MDTNPIVNIHNDASSSSSSPILHKEQTLNEIFGVIQNDESSIGVNFLKFMNFFQRTEQFHPLSDQEKHSGKFKKIALSIIYHILDRELIYSTNQSPILKLFDLSPSEILRMNNLMNTTREIVLKLSDSIISQHLIRIEPLEDDNDEFSLPLKQFVEKQMLRLKDFLIQIVKIYKTRKYNLKELGYDKEGNKQPLKYIVIGSGPIGLLSAIEASLLLPKLYIIEKRTNYSRDVWFDLYPKPFSQSVELLDELAFSTEFPNLEIKISSVADSDGDERRTYTVRCQITQRFLSKVIYLLDNVEFIFGSQYISQCKVKIPKVTNPNSYSHNSILENRWKDIGFKLNSESEYQVALFYHGKSKECYSHIDYMSFNETQDLCSQFGQESFLNSKCKVERIPFDILIGSDGLYSTVRSSLNITTRDIHSFDVSNTLYAQTLSRDQIPKITVKPRLEQVALIINFKRTADNDCPDTAIDEDTGEFIDPWKPSLLLDNVCSVFKRFYAGHCHMQILFDNNYGQKAIEKYMHARRNALKQLLDKNKEGSVVNSVILETEAKEIRSAAFADASRDSSYDDSSNGDTKRVIPNWEEDAFDWIKIMSIVNTVLAEPYKNVNDFREAIVNSDTFTGDKQLEKKYDMVLLRVVLQKAENLTRVIQLDNPTNPYAINILKGDSVASAHFRLGVGVNNAFLAFGEITTLIRNLVLLGQDQNVATSSITKDNLEKSMEIYEEKAQFRWNRLINYMATAMYFESFCNTVVFIDPGEYFGIQTIQQKDYDSLDYIPFENLYQVKRFCQAQDKQSLWWN
ncbi:predicted protein [Naegleria gruberi]|uniref:Predicted protein n=1 Tax=Naegleria gruberi TaxID=5762 RepID=D2VX17_NAEGR|nr:uncharacterized protein NAEGRDRAFT_81539 [Naegleria gruberi]EFC38542.1 predicted protein [Naegleria gruberi]|eukprot:XP_002671286.1 predicted protein [Naegleria gruberi strain NEG-M]